MRQVQWHRQRLTLSKLAFGCAPVMGRIGRRQALNAMAMAFDLGVTHFDVARSYGFGDAERVVGRFLASRRGRVTVATKFGIQPRASGFAARLARPALRLARNMLPGASRIARSHSAAMLAAGHYSLAEAQASVDLSLRELGLETVDLLLVHDCTRDAVVHDDVLRWLQNLRTQGKIRAWGFATSGGHADFYRGRHGSTDAVIQRELRVQDLALHDCGLIGHSPFSVPRALTRTSVAGQQRIEAWLADRSLRSADLPSLLLETALHASGDGVILCSMFTPGHIQSNTRCLASPRFTPELRAGLVKMLTEANAGTGGQ